MRPAPMEQRTGRATRPTSVDDRARCKEALHRMERGITGRLLDQIARMDELVAKPRVVVRIEYAPHPIDDLGDAPAPADIRMIGQPDIEREMDADIDRDDGRIERTGI